MRRSNIKRGTLVASAAAAMLLMAQASQAHIATISGGYDLNAYDTPELLFNNTSVYDFNGAQMVLTGYQGLNNGQTNTVALGNITSGSVLDVIWGGALPQQSPLFLYDYDDSKGGPGPCPPSPINSGLCAIVGNFYVTFTATLNNPSNPSDPNNGMPIYSQFSPSTNATGGFVPWEGLNQIGQSEDPCCDVHSGSVTGTLAYIDIGTPPPITTPEPASIALVGAGLAGLGMLRRRRS